MVEKATCSMLSSRETCSFFFLGELMVVKGVRTGECRRCPPLCIALTSVVLQCKEFSRPMVDVHPRTGVTQHW